MSGKFVVVDTEYGPVKGVKKDNVLGMEYINFQGIPYMKPPVAELKFRDPQPPEKWTEPLDATGDVPSFCTFDEFTFEKVGQLDAMFVNVFTKNVDPKVPTPVMVFIHGGGYVFGSSTTREYGPDFFMQKNVILVTLNYRIGAFGFLSLEDETLGVPGNAGLKDQTFALKWVKNNIQNFGGDSNNITVFGESAGAGSVHYHLISESSKGLFNRAILMSGVSFNKTWNMYPRHDWAGRLAKAVGWDGNGGDKEILEYLEGVEPMEIVEAYTNLLTIQEKSEQNILLPFGPTIEPYVSKSCFIPKDPVLMARKAWGNDIDVLMGGVSNEGIYIFSLMAAMFPDEVPLYISNFQNSLPLELSVEYGSEKALEYSKMLKKLYYGCTEPSMNNLQGYFYFLADVHFWHGIFRALQSRVNSGKTGKTFFYRFNVDAALNMYKKLNPLVADFPGASHADDLLYLFHTFLGADVSIESKEFSILKRMLSIYTNFAATGDPNVPELGENVIWEPVQSIGLPIKAMHITNDENSCVEIPENERIAVWNEIYQKENCELF